MATTIDIENAKQIRQPMDVVIEMNVPDTSVALTYSGYFTTSKISDGELDETTWPMRELADLQGQGFPLDGSRELYDSGVLPSEANGKIGVRGNVGESVNVTVRGNKTISALTVFATGASSVTYNGTTYTIVGGQAIIGINGTTANLTFNPAYTDQRVEISEIIAGTVLRATNETIIRCVVSLRSDLSITSPTLPESELNVEIYNDADISQQVANLPEETPITYSAGYPGDMSPTRKFYVSGQVTWADNVLTIHAVDAVHFLDIPMPSVAWFDNDIEVTEILKFMRRTFSNLGFINVQSETLPVAKQPISSQSAVVAKGASFRDVTAELMNLYRFRNVSQNYIKSGSNSFVIDYVDAGIPTFRFIPSNSPKWTIKEEDCAEIQTQVDRGISAMSATLHRMRWTGERNDVEVGSCEWVKGSGAFLSIDDYVTSFRIGLVNPKITIGPTYYELVAPLTPKGNAVVYGAAPKGVFGGARWYEGPKVAFTGDVPNLSTFEEGPFGVGEADVYSQVVPWSASFTRSVSPNTQSGLWAKYVSDGLIDSGAKAVQTTLIGGKLTDEILNVTFSTNSEGIEEKIEPRQILGQLYFTTEDYSTTGVTAAYPNVGISAAARRSKKTGSFTWKGDPRMQPRDVASLAMRNGTRKTVTLENITLTHERGGLSAEITYREGAI